MKGRQKYWSPCRWCYSNNRPKKQEAYCTTAAQFIEWGLILNAINQDFDIVAVTFL